MSARWGHVGLFDKREYRASCEECAWIGESHYELDSEAVRLSAIDSAEHNDQHHRVQPEVQPEPVLEGMLF